MIENNTTVRETAAHFGISKSTVHKDVSERLKKVNIPLYNKAKAVLKTNKEERHIRGGIATKKKYEFLKAEQLRKSSRGNCR